MTGDLLDDPFVRIAVSGHALERSRQWLGTDDPSAIRGEIRSAIAAGRVSAYVPDWTRGHPGLRPAESLDADVRRGCWFVWDRDATRCWIVYEHHDRIEVATLVLEHEAEVRLSEQRRLRTGYRRA